MAIYHYSASVIKRSSGRTATAAAAYRAGAKIVDERIGQTFDYSRKNGVYYSKILVPFSAENLPWVQNRSELWNRVEQVEKRVDAQIAREVNVALPIELNHEQKIALIEEYVRDNYNALGMVADINIHDIDTHNPHAHIMLTMRDILGEEFGKKNRTWNDKQLLMTQRENWAKICNRYLEETGIKERIDHRSNKDRQIKSIPQIHLGPNVAAMKIKGIETDRGDIYDSIIEANREIEQCQEKIEQINDDIGLLAFNIFQQKCQEEEKKRQELENKKRQEQEKKRQEEERKSQEEEKKRQEEEQKRQKLEDKKRQEQERLSRKNNHQIATSDDLKYADGLYYASCPQFGENRRKKIEIGDSVGTQTKLSSGNFHYQLKQKNDVILDFIVDENQHNIDIITCKISEEDNIAEQLLIEAEIGKKYCKLERLERANLAHDRAEIMSSKLDNQHEAKMGQQPENLERQNQIELNKKQENNLSTSENTAWIATIAREFLWKHKIFEYRDENYHLKTDRNYRSISIVEVESNHTVIDLIQVKYEFWNTRAATNITQKNVDDFKEIEKYLQQLQSKNQNNHSTTTPNPRRKR